LTVDKYLEKFFFILYKLAEMGAHKRTIKISTKFLAEKMGLSQQTISRYLIELERINWIQRTTMRDGSFIHISHLGENNLRKVCTALNLIFDTKYPLSLTIKGEVFNGLGEGAYYIMQKQYKEQFIEKLGFNPYPGTLNLKLTSEYDIKIIKELETYPGIEILGFKNKDRTYGSVKCFHATINNKIKGALVLALRSHYDSSVIEVIAPKYLRGSLKLKDGNEVNVEIFVSK
jgi:riboflavin kinase